jgi:hypothetical protein
MNANSSMIAGFSTLLLLCITLGAQVKHSNNSMSELVENPVLGIAYNPLVVHYETVSDEFRKLCPKHDYKPQAIYAHVRSGSADYYVTAMVDPRVDDNASIAIVLLNNGTCTDGDIQWAYSAIPPKHGYVETGIVERIPGPSATEIATASGDFQYEIRSAHEEWILRSLDEDALQRGIKAYKSEVRFGKLFCGNESKFPRSDDYPIDKEVFGAYCAKQFHK